MSLPLDHTIPPSHQSLVRLFVPLLVSPLPEKQGLLPLLALLRAYLLASQDFLFLRVLLSAGLSKTDSGAHFVDATSLYFPLSSPFI